MPLLRLSWQPSMESQDTQLWKSFARATFTITRERPVTHGVCICNPCRQFCYYCHNLLQYVLVDPSACLFKIVCVCVCMYMAVWMCACVCVWLLVYVSLAACMCACMCACGCVYVCVWLCRFVAVANKCCHLPNAYKTKERYTRWFNKK